MFGKTTTFMRLPSCYCLQNNKWLVHVAFLLIVSSGYAQSHFMLDNYTGIYSEGNVILQWTLNRGQTCNGTVIFRISGNGPTVKIGEIAGECGSPSEARRYTFVDESPVPGVVNDYTLELGIWGRTEPALSLFVPGPGVNGFIISPHPVTPESRLYFSNPHNETFTLSLFTLTGQRICSFTTTDNRIDLNDFCPWTHSATHLSGRMLLFSLTDETRSKTHSAVIKMAP